MSVPDQIKELRKECRMRENRLSGAIIDDRYEDALHEAKAACDALENILCLTQNSETKEQSQ